MNDTVPQRKLIGHASTLRWSVGFTIGVAIGIVLLVRADPQGNVPLAYIEVVPSAALLAASSISLWLVGREPRLAHLLDLVCAWLAVLLTLQFALLVFTSMPNFGVHQCAPGEEDYGYFTDQSCLPNAVQFRMRAMVWIIICAGFAVTSAVCFWAASLARTDVAVRDKGHDLLVGH
jgi:hypothetical protein